MKSVLQFFRVTLVGGILFLLPVIILAIIGGKAFAVAHKIVAPLAADLPVQSVFGLNTPRLLAIMLIVLFCFLTGVFARTAFAQKIINWLEQGMLSNLPGYEFIKNTSQNLLAAEKQQVYPVILVRIEDCWQLGFLIERLDGGHVTVFIPGVPSPQSGSLYYMTEDRIKPMDIPSGDALKCLKRYGLGSNALLGSRLSAASQSVFANKPE